MKAFFLHFIFFTVMAMPFVYGQTKTPPRVQNLFLKAENYRTHFAYSKAIDHYERFLIYKRNSTEAMVNLADCYFKVKDFTQALAWYDSALKYGGIHPPHGIQYTNLLLHQGMSEKAKAWLTSYIQDHPEDQQAREKLEGIENMSFFFKDSILYKVKNLPVNSPSPEFAPVLYKDGFIFVSARGKKANPFLDLYYCHGLDSGTTKVEPFSDKINTKLHEGPLTVYDQEKKIIFTRNNEVQNRKMNDISVVHFQLFSAEKDETGQWAEPQLLSLNSKQYSMGHPTITEDGKTLYFSSTAPGGYGGSDIFKSQWQNNGWGKPENLGPNVNTAGNEMFPYIFKDSILYFASDGYRGLGGLDIYKTNLTSGSNKVFNMGYPINTIKDDFSIVFYPEGNKGFFASNRDGGQGNDDIYSFFIKPAAIPQPAPTEKIEPPVYYTVQILALKNPKLVHKTFLKELKGVVKHRGKDGLQRYTYGEYQGADDALQMLETIRAMGYQDAFIRKVEKYSELSEAPGENIDLLYEKMSRVK